MRTGDIVCDVDRLYSAISFNAEHHSELYALGVASRLQEALLDIIRDRQGDWRNAYVISLANTREKLREAMERVNADEAVFIDTPFETCMERAREKRPFYFPLIISEWFETGDLT